MKLILGLITGMIIFGGFFASTFNPAVGYTVIFVTGGLYAWYLSASSKRSTQRKQQQQLFDLWHLQQQMGKKDNQ